MKTGMCGNIALDALASELDKAMPGGEIVVGRVGAYREELTEPPAGFRDLDACIVALDWRSLAPDLYAYGHGDCVDTTLSRMRTACSELALCITRYRAACKAPVMIFSPISELRGPDGFIARLLTPSRIDVFADCQKIFDELCRSLVDVYPVDVELLSGQIGKDNALDPHRRLHTGDPFTTAMTQSIARHLASMCVQLRRPPLKCLVLDLDGTLWGGVVGEDGVDNLVLRDTGEGLAFKEFQAEIVKLHKQGVLLAICSKNNTCDALEVLELHPHMLIRPSMISCFRINWDEKPRNLIGISSELNIGLDAMMFVDNSPTEREMVRATLPEVEVFDLPADPALYAEAMRKCSRFWPLQITSDDARRTRLYAEERLRKEG